MFGNVYYYEGKDGKIYVGRDIAIAAKIVHNVELKTKKDLDESTRNAPYGQSLAEIYAHELYIDPRCIFRLSERR